MRKARRVGRLRVVVDEKRTRLTLELDLDADPIAGYLQWGSRPAEQFIGWMALTRAIELTLEAARGTLPTIAGAPSSPTSDPSTARDR
jgi:hypothetical protein